MSAKFNSVFMESILTFVTYFCEILILKNHVNLPNKEANEAVVAEKRTVFNWRDFWNEHGIMFWDQEFYQVPQVSKI